MEQAKREVNSEVVEINADDIKDKSEETEDLDEEVIPPVEEEKEPKAKETPKEEKAEEPVEKQPEETPESSPEEKEEVAPPKPVEGETPIEKARRLEIQRLRKVIRDGDKAKLFQGTEVKESKEAVDKYESLKAKYTPEELENMEELFGVIADKKGFVKKGEAYETTANSVLDSFLEDHTEYSEEKDTEDLRWSTFKRILSEDYNLQNKTPKQIKSIFSKVDRDVKEELGESTVKGPIFNKEKVAAEKQKIQSVSHSGGTKSESTSKKGKVDTSNPIGGIKFSGFEEDDFTE